MSDTEQIQMLLKDYEDGDYADIHVFPEIYHATGLSWEDWSDYDRAKAFLSKVYMPASLYKDIIALDPFVSQGYSFRTMVQQPRSCFPKGVKVRSYPGGSLFDIVTYESLRSVLNRIGEEYMFICGGLENEKENDPVRLAIPTNLTWNDIIEGGYGVYNIFTNGYGCFRVFGKKRDLCLLSVLINARPYKSGNYVGFAGELATEYHELYKTVYKKYDGEPSPPLTDDLLRMLGYEIKDHHE